MFSGGRSTRPDSGLAKTGATFGWTWTSGWGSLGTFLRMTGFWAGGFSLLVFRAVTGLTGATGACGGIAAWFWGWIFAEFWGGASFSGVSGSFYGAGLKIQSFSRGAWFSSGFSAATGFSHAAVFKTSSPKIGFGAANGFKLRTGFWPGARTDFFKTFSRWCLKNFVSKASSCTGASVGLRFEMLESRFSPIALKLRECSFGSRIDSEKILAAWIFSERSDEPGRMIGRWL